MTTDFKDYRSYTVPLYFLGAIGFLCFAYQTFNLTLFGDDWAMIYYSELTGRYSVGAGRWLAWIIWIVFVDNAFMPVVTMTLACLLLGASALVISDTLELGPIGRIVFLLLYVSNPFLIEPFAFNVGQIPLAISMLLAAIAAQCMVGAIRAEDRRTLIVQSLIATLCLVGTAAIYQTSALTVLVVLNFYLLLHHHDLAGKRFGRFALVSLAVLATSAVIYVVTVYLSWKISPYGALNRPEYDIRGGYAGLSPIFRRFLELRTIWADYLTGSVHGHFVVTKWLLIGLFVTAYARFAWDAFKRRQPSGLLVPLSFLACLVIPFVLFVLREAYLVRYNTLVPMGVMLALPPAMLVAALERGPLRNVVVALCGVVVAGNVFVHNIVALGKELIFERDLAITSRILDRIEPNLTEADIAKDVFVQFVGTLPKDTMARPFGDGPGPREGQKYFVSSIAECGIFSCQPLRFFSAVGLVQTGVKYRMAFKTFEGEEAERVRAMPTWPAGGSVAKVGERWVIKLSEMP